MVNENNMKNNNGGIRILTDN